MRFIKNKKSIALVLSGGGVKAAAFHIGVCLALREKGFKFVGGLAKDYVDEDPAPKIRTYVGSSAGSIISTFLASGYQVDDLIDAFEMGIKSKDRTTSPRLKPLTYWDIFSLDSPGLLKSIPSKLRKKSLVTGGFEAFLKNGLKFSGLFSVKGLEKYLRTNVLPTNKFSDLAANLYIVATRLNQSGKTVFGPVTGVTDSGETQYADYANISDAAAASMALPPMFGPYGIKNDRGDMRYFFDGEIRDTLSTHIAVDFGADLVISSYSIQPYKYSPKMGSLHEYGIPIIVNQALYQLVEQKIQRHIANQDTLKTIYNSVDGYFKQMDLPEEHREKLLEIICKKANYKPDVEYLYIHPNPQDYEMFFVDHFSLNRDILERIVKIGFKAALKTLRRYEL